ncbi:hypothetical protein BH09PSE6_BH09PSE6_30440 [soil metagenome]
MELKLAPQSVASPSLASPSIAEAIGTCLKWGGLYGVIVMLVAHHLTQLALTESALFVGIPAGLAAAVAMARRLDRGLPTRPVDLPVEASEQA